MLSVEERAFKRIGKRLLAPDCLISNPSPHLPTPPPDASTNDDNTAAEDVRAKHSELTEEQRQWRDDMILDFAAFKASIARIQFLRISNEQERERYAMEKVKILDTAQAIRQSTSDLRIQLEEAQKLLALRKTYDELAERITGNRMLRPREDQYDQIEKLDLEIAALEQESRDYSRTWAERREQFGRIVEEGRQMLRIIRDEKEEAERKEGMEGRGDVDEGDGPVSRAASHAGTPRPDQGGATPLRAGSEPETTTDLKLPPQRFRAAPTSSPALANSRQPSPAQQATNKSKADDPQDTEMTEASTQPITEKVSNEEEIEEGEEPESTPPIESMEVT